MSLTKINLPITLNSKVCLTELAEPYTLNQFIMECIIFKLSSFYPFLPKSKLVMLTHGYYSSISEFEKEINNFKNE